MVTNTEYQRERAGEFDGNRLGSKADDLFGFHAIASVVAEAISNRQDRNCLVIGLEGDWGSGKSFMLSMLTDELRSGNAVVANFVPWLVGSRDALLDQLFSVLEKTVADQRAEEGDTTDTTVNAAKAGLAWFRNYSGAVSGVGRLVEVAGNVGLVPGGVVAGKAIRGVSETMKEKIHEQTIEEVKERTSTALSRLQRRIVIVIDDLDRLEPKEAVEVLRLVQAVADFPNVTYILSYDRWRLARAIQVVTQLDDGAAYLEKLMQLIVPLPLPQPVALIDMFTRRLKDLTQVEELPDRLAKIVVRHIGPRVTTPRGVVRVLDSVRLLWQSLNDRVDLTDLVWLQLVRVENVRLYRWIEAYVAEASRSADIESKSEARSRLQKQLDALLKTPEASGPQWEELRSFLPQIGNSSGNKTESLLLTPSDTVEARAALKTGLLSSVETARLYFGLLLPDGVTAQKEFRSLLAISVDGAAVAAKLKVLAEHPSDGGPALVDLVLDLVNTSLRELGSPQLIGISIGLLSAIDDILRIAPVADRGVFRATLARLLDELAGLLTQHDWSYVLEAALQNEQAVDFLTAEFPEPDKKPPAWMGVEMDRNRVRSHLASVFASMPDNTMARMAQYGRIMSVWEITAPAERKDFLGRVLSQDPLFKDFVLGLFRRLVKGDHAMRDLARHFFVHELDRYWGTDVVLKRLIQLVPTDLSEAGDINSAIALIEEVNRV